MFVFASAACLDNKENQVGMTIRNHFNPVPRQDQTQRHTKLMFTLFNGGKSQAGCTVKFSKFYLIVDCLAHKRAANGTNLHLCIQKFITALNKGMSSGKSGAAAFKPNEEGSYFNAFPTINETLKQIEDAIA